MIKHFCSSLMLTAVCALNIKSGGGLKSHILYDNPGGGKTQLWSDDDSDQELTVRSKQWQDIAKQYTIRFSGRQSQELQADLELQSKDFGDVEVDQSTHDGLSPYGDYDRYFKITLTNRNLTTKNIAFGWPALWKQLHPPVRKDKASMAAQAKARREVMVMSNEDHYDAREKGRSKNIIPDWNRGTFDLRHKEREHIVIQIDWHDFMPDDLDSVFDMKVTDVSEAMTGAGENYRGVQNHTKKGLGCLNWVDRSGMTVDEMNVKYPDKGLGDHNYCRNHDGHTAIWCYTTDKHISWQECQPLQKTQPEEQSEPEME